MHLGSAKALALSTAPRLGRRAAGYRPARLNSNVAVGIRSRLSFASKCSSETFGTAAVGMMLRMKLCWYSPGPIAIYLDNTAALNVGELL